MNYFLCSDSPLGEPKRIPSYLFFFTTYTPLLLSKKETSNMKARLDSQIFARSKTPDWNATIRCP